MWGTSVRILLPASLGTLVTATTGQGFHLTATLLTFASLITGAVTAIAVAVLQTRRRPASTEISVADDALSEYAVKRLSYLEAEVAAKDRIISDLREELKQCSRDNGGQSADGGDTSSRRPSI